MKKSHVIIVIVVWCSSLFAADLIINGQDNQTYQNQTYGHLSITNSSNITLRNCRFATSYATNAGNGVGDIRGSNHITIDSCDFNGDSTTCTGMNVSGTYITIRKCKIHDVADDGFQCNTGNHIYFYNNTISHLYGCGTDGGCGPCYNGHSDAFELGMLDSVELIGNLVYDVRSTSAIILDNYQGDSANVHNLLVENNIFYTPETGVIVYVFYVDGIRMYNNTFWKSNWLGITIGVYATRIEAYNNIVQCIDYTFGGGTLSSDHKYDYNLVGITGRGLPLQTHDVSAVDPKFRRIPAANDNTAAHLYRDVTPADFELLAGSPAIGKGMSGGPIPTTDFYGNQRKIPYDMGAIAYQSSGVNSPRSSGRSGLHRSFLRIGANSRMQTIATIAGLSVEEPVVLDIYSVSGQRVRFLRAPARESSLTWDGKNDRGVLVPEGMYYLTVSGLSGNAATTVMLSR